MKYIVAGGLGFVGSEICRQLLDRSKYPLTEQVLIIDDNSKGYSTSKINDLLLDSRLKIWYLDLTQQIDTVFHLRHTHYNGYGLVGHFAEADYIINCAALIGGIGYFNKIPAQILRNNNLILSNILDEIVKLSHKERPHLVQLSSSMVFEAATEFPSKESDLETIRVPITAYGFSKLSSEFYCKAFAQEYGVRYTIVRPFNAVGPEKPDPNFVGHSHVLPDFVCKIKNGQGIQKNPLKILGSGKQVRHYTDVKEVAEGILRATHHPHAINNDFNIAINKGHSVLEVARLVWKSISKDKSELVYQLEEGFPHDVELRTPDITKTTTVLGWKAKITLEDNIDSIVQSVLDLL